MSSIIITVAYRMQVVPEWYDPQVLSGEGSLQDQICEYEKSRVERDGLYIADLKTESIDVKFAPEPEIEWCGDDKNHSKHTHVIDTIKYRCLGRPTTSDGVGSEERLLEQELDEKELVESDD